MASSPSAIPIDEARAPCHRLDRRDRCLPTDVRRGPVERPPVRLERPTLGRPRARRCRQHPHVSRRDGRYRRRRDGGAGSGYPDQLGAREHALASQARRDHLRRRRADAPPRGRGRRRPRRGRVPRRMGSSSPRWDRLGGERIAVCVARIRGSSRAGPVRPICPGDHGGLGGRRRRAGTTGLVLHAGTTLRQRLARRAGIRPDPPARRLADARSRSADGSAGLHGPRVSGRGRIVPSRARLRGPHEGRRLVGLARDPDRAERGPVCGHRPVPSMARGGRAASGRPIVPDRARWRSRHRGRTGVVAPADVLWLGRPVRRGGRRRHRHDRRREARDPGAIRPLSRPSCGR